MWNKRENRSILLLNPGDVDERLRTRNDERGNERRLKFVVNMLVFVSASVGVTTAVEFGGDGADDTLELGEFLLDILRGGVLAAGFQPLVGVLDGSVKRLLIRVVEFATEAFGVGELGFEGEDGVVKLAGSGVETEGADVSWGGDRLESRLDGGMLDTADGGSGMSSAEISSLSKRDEGRVGILGTLGLRTQ